MNELPATLGLDAGHVCLCVCMCVSTRKETKSREKKSTRKYVILTLGIGRWSRIMDNLTDDGVLSSFFFMSITFFKYLIIYFILYINTIFDNFC